MKDTRPIHVKYFELTIKVKEDLKNNQEAYESLKQKSEKENNLVDKEFYQCWANMLSENIKATNLSLILLNEKIKALGIYDQINELIIRREKKSKL